MAGSTSCTLGGNGVVRRAVQVSREGNEMFADVDPSGYELLLSEPEIVAWLEAEEPEDGDADEALQAA
jgi:hypothetical protein